MGVFGITKFEGENNARTMKVEGFIRDSSVLVLIDSGATHNFISPKIVKALGLTIVPTKTMRVCLGGDHPITTKGKCTQLNLGLSQYKYKGLYAGFGWCELHFRCFVVSNLGEGDYGLEIVCYVMHMGELVRLKG